MELTQLRMTVEAECAAFRQARDDRDRLAGAARLFELCCAYEQVLSDLYFEIRDERRGWIHASARTFAALASRIAGSLFLEAEPTGLDDAVARIEAQVGGADRESVTTLGDLPEQYVKLPECFMRDLLDLGSYARFARDRLARMAPEAVLVVGIRTTGSYLAPIWDAALRAVGIPGVALTARPKRNPRIDATGRFADPAPLELWVPPDEDAEAVRQALAGRDPRAVSAVVVDDLAFTGSQFVRVDNYLGSLGLTGSNITFVQNAPLIMNSLTSAAYDRLSARRVWAAPKTPDAPRRPGAEGVQFFGDLLARVDGEGPDIEVRSVQLAPPTFAQRHLAAHTTVPVEQFVHFNPRGRDRHYLIEATVDGRPTRLFAKVFGVGFFAERELHRIRRFADVSYQVVAHRGGFLCYEWIPGEPLGPDDAHLLDEEDIDQLSRYAAMVNQFNRVGEISRASYADDVIGRLRGVMDLDGERERRLESALSLFLREPERAVPVVNAPRNQGHWHHVRATDGKLRRVHLDLGEWSWRADVAEELASIVIELGLSQAQARRLIARYVTQTGDIDVAHRMTMAAASYVARTLDSYRYWDGQIEQIPLRYRRTADDPLVVRQRRRRTRMLLGLDRALAVAEEVGSYV